MDSRRREQKYLHKKVAQMFLKQDRTVKYKFSRYLFLTLFHLTEISFCIQINSAIKSNNCKLLADPVLNISPMVIHIIQTIQGRNFLLFPFYR